MQFILLALVVLLSITKKGEIVAKMASHAIFQYNVLAIDDTHNTGVMDLEVEETVGVLHAPVKPTIKAK